MASVRKRGDKWIAQVLLPNRKYRAKTFPTKPLAVAWARDFEAARDRGETVPATRPEDITIGQLWGPFIALRRGSIAPNTVAKNTSQWKNHIEPGFGDKPVASVRKSTVQLWVVRQIAAGVGLPTIQSSINLLGAIMESAIEDDLIFKNPTHGVDIPREAPPVPRFLTTAELNQILANIEDPEHRLLFALLGGTGLRIGEALGLTAVDVTREGSAVYINKVWTRHGPRKVPKGKEKFAVRWVPVPTHLRAEMRAHARNRLGQTPLFYGDDRNLNRRVLAPACEAVGGLEWVTLHQLRHHACSVWIAAGVPTFEIARILGHSSTRMVEATYGHLTPGAHDRIVAAMDSAHAGRAGLHS